MKVLVIPDVHLKPWMFERASELMKEGKADRAVCLMDIPDDWRQEFNLDLYINTFDAAIAFAKEHPDTLWCYGNHDICYPWNQRETGYSKIAPWTFCHGGLADEYVLEYLPAKIYHDVDAVIEAINGFGVGELWNDLSPIWYRPQYYKGKMYKPRKLLQVVGHTPVESITKKGNLISCDVFSTYRDGKPIGTQEFLLLDTVSWELGGVK